MIGDRHVRRLQAELNEFTRRFVDGISPIPEDGVSGPGTEARVKLVKVFLGYPTTAAVTDERLLAAVAHVTALATLAVERDQAARNIGTKCPTTRRLGRRAAAVY